MLEQILKQQIENIKKGSIDSERIIRYVDYQSKYAVLKPKVTVEVELTKGVKATIDITDFFEEELK